ncbi:MAG TPA: hypothetical protein VFS31_14320, partial [Chitinophagaceae bacterium]|nr:hypothetical protein [Chitinophagaceae bacterium]
AIIPDAANKGSFPDSQYSVRLMSSGTVRHLFSPKVVVDPATKYLLKNYLYVAASSGGAVGFYIDEYDAGGNWISGQYKATETSIFAEMLNFMYAPTSSSVRMASLQVIVSAGGVLTAYLDNVQWLSLP